MPTHPLTRLLGEDDGGRTVATGYGIGLAKERLDRCVVGLLEEWKDTLSVVKHWFPWMKFK